MHFVWIQCYSKSEKKKIALPQRDASPQTDRTFICQVFALKWNKIAELLHSKDDNKIFSSIILSLRTTIHRKMWKICQTFSSRSHKTCLTQFVIKLFLFLSVKTPTKWHSHFCVFFTFCNFFDCAQTRQIIVLNCKRSAFSPCGNFGFLRKWNF